MNVDLKQQGAQFWDGNPCGGSWRNYSEFMDWIQRTEPYIFHVLDRYDWRDKRALEVGCGQGSTLNYLPGLGAHMHGIDMSEASLARARAGAEEIGHADRVELTLGDAEHLLFPDKFFDAVVCIGVLHHTQNTERGVQEIWRVLKPGGFAIVMLYRSGNPKWWATQIVRGLSHIIDRVYGRQFVVADRLRYLQKNGDAQGTALLELFGVPVLKASSNKECRAMFHDFSSVIITNYQPGFERLCDILSWLQPFRTLLRYLDARLQHYWGFYQVIEAYK